MRAKRFRPVVAGVVLLLFSLGSAFAILGMRTNRAPAGGPGEQSEFDPYLAAMKVSTPEDLRLIQEAQIAATKLGADRADLAAQVNAARIEVLRAIDELYEKIRLDPKYDQARDQWRSCMATLGTPAEDPNDVERQMESAGAGSSAGVTIVPGVVYEVTRSETPPDQTAPPMDDLPLESDPEDQRLFANRSTCDGVMRPAADDVARALVPDWLVEHSETFDRYRSLLMQVIDR